MEPRAGLDILDLPETILCYQIFSFLRLKEFMRASFLCNKTIRDYCKQDGLWIERWRRLEAKRKEIKLSGVPREVPERLRNKLFLVVCRNQSQSFQQKIDDERKRRKMLIATRGPVQALRRFVLNSFQTDGGNNKAIHARKCRTFYASEVGFHVPSMNSDDMCSMFQRCTSERIEPALKVPLRIVARKQRFNEKWLEKSFLCSPVSIRGGGRAFSGSTSLKLEIDDKGRRAASNEEFLPSCEQKILSFIVLGTGGERGKLSEDVCFAPLVPSLNEECSVVGSCSDISLVSAHIFPLTHGRKHGDFRGSLATARWQGDSSPTFIMASIPHALLERRFSRETMEERGNHTSEDSDACKAIRTPKTFVNCSLQCTARTFGQVIWEAYFDDIGGQEFEFVGENSKLRFHLLGPQANRGIDERCCARGLDGLSVATQAGISCVIKDCVVLDVTIFNADGEAMWARSEAVDCKWADSVEQSYGTFDMTLSHSSRKVANIGDETSVLVSVEFELGRVGDTLDDDQETAIVSDVSLEFGNGASSLCHHLRIE